MKHVIAGLALLAATTIAAPTDYTPPGGWESVKYPAGTGENLHEYPEGTGEDLDKYPAPPGGWENVVYPPGTGSSGTSTCQNGPFKFTSTYHVTATPDQVVNGTTPTGGLPGAIGYYDIGLNSELDLICYNIRLVNYRGGYTSPANTATHIHEAGKGASGPPRIAFPNPLPAGDDFVSVGCLMAPFKTGLPDNTTGLADSGDGFSVSQIETNPAAFFADVHSGLAVPGAVRGQLA